MYHGSEEGSGLLERALRVCYGQATPDRRMWFDASGSGIRGGGAPSAAGQNIAGPVNPVGRDVMDKARR